MNTWGHNLRLSIFGESHGAGVGITVDGLPAGLPIDLAAVQVQMRRRAPGQNNWSSPRVEADEVDILGGIHEGRTTGAPICGLIRNQNAHSQDYQTHLLRPGHADWTAWLKHHGHADMRGGGHFSGRLTAPLVFAGALAMQVLEPKGVRIGAHISRIGSVTDVGLATGSGSMASDDSMTGAGLAAGGGFAAGDGFAPSPGASDFQTAILNVFRQDFPTLDPSAGQRMRQLIEEAHARGDSLGGEIEGAAFGVPGGLGSPFFDSMESSMASLLFSIPAVKGVAFGLGFDFCSLRGSEANDELSVQNGKITALTNHNGGILGGITSGMPVGVRVAIKPTPSIAIPQRTVDVAAMANIIAATRGRHDPCILPRAVVVVEAAMAICVLDALLAEGPLGVMA